MDDRRGGGQEVPEHLVELAQRESAVMDQVWVLLSGGDKGGRISYKEIERFSGILGLNLCEEEIKSMLFWGKYSRSKDFKKIQDAWLDVETGSSGSQEGIGDSKAESDLGTQVDKESLKDIEINYAEFCEIFKRNERDRKRRMTEKIDLSNVK
ncbi:hypothetical protein OJ253_3316 [Cryptosporidium canis]|uniref:EF-hand domain-containing protein n=1 Tax=Cryptosporidium canis TaxID=195482 RepID=A0A9D5HWA2_9CRYT|nr:hypothetical protein OJ253_3316 [Cryptosporidium canis]